MGIQGLLQKLKNIQEEISIKEFKGQTVVIDGYTWMHKACYACAFELGTGQKTNKYVDYILKRVQMLQHYGVTPLLVFDGGKAPLKDKTQMQRRETRRTNKTLGLECYQKALGLSGDARRKKMNEARDFFQRAINVTPELVANLIQMLKTSNIRYMVAPYEADAQLVHLCKIGEASAIITEDSDVLVYCVSAQVDCPILYKMDECGIAKKLSLSILTKGTLHSSEKFIKNLPILLQDNGRLFIQLCILSGCDFLDSLPNVGIMTAQKLLIDHHMVESEFRIQRILNKLKVKGTAIPECYKEMFHKAEAIFYHHIVFDVVLSKCVMFLESSHDDISKMIHGTSIDQPFLGVIVSPTKARRISRGEIHPHSHEQYSEFPSELGEMKSPNTKFHENQEEFSTPREDMNKNNQESQEKRKRESIHHLFPHPKKQLVKRVPNDIGRVPNEGTLEKVNTKKNQGGKAAIFQALLKSFPKEERSNVSQLSTTVPNAIGVDCSPSLNASSFRKKSIVKAKALKGTILQYFRKT